MTEPAPTGRDLQRELALLAAKNERLSDALLAAREQIVELKRQVDDLAKPPGTYAVFLGARPDGSVDVISAGRKMHVGASPAVDLSRLKPGQEVAVLGFTFNEEKGEPVLRAEYLWVGGKAYGLRSSPA